MIWLLLVMLPFAAGQPKISRKARVIVAVPSVVMLLLFYSVAIHIHQALGAWPESIGTNGFPKGLLWHSDVGSDVFGALLFFTLFILPVIFLVAVFSKRFRGVIPYLSAHAIAFGICLGLTCFAPSGFLRWWWD